MPDSSDEFRALIASPTRLEAFIRRHCRNYINISSPDDLQSLMDLVLDRLMSLEASSQLDQLSSDQVSAYLRQAVRYSIRDYLRYRWQNREVTGELAEIALAETPQNENSVSIVDWRESVENAIRHWKPANKDFIRTVIRLRLEGRTEDEISKSLGMEKSTYRDQVKRFMSLLIEILNPES